MRNEVKLTVDGKELTVIVETNEMERQRLAKALNMWVIPQTIKDNY